MLIKSVADPQCGCQRDDSHKNMTFKITFKMSHNKMKQFIMT